MTNHISAKLIKSLHQKKHRQETKKFIVEGAKNVEELLKSDFQIENIYATKEFTDAHKELLSRPRLRSSIVQADELKALGTLEHNDGALAIVMQKDFKMPTAGSDGIILALDDIRDPGNLGTLIRIADWYGIKHIVCSPNCVDLYNPKVISATMGSFARVSVSYAPLPAFLKAQKSKVLGGFLGGDVFLGSGLADAGVLVIGSESHGISREVEKCVTDKITIPKFGNAESLNAAVAGGIIIDRWKGSI